MKKLKLKALALGANDVLSREQLKTILGGKNAFACTIPNEDPSKTPNCPPGMTAAGCQNSGSSYTAWCYIGETCFPIGAATCS